MRLGVLGVLAVDGLLTGMGMTERSERYEIRFSGEGGQGIVLAGVILAEAAAIYDGRNATQTQVYGPESRGGTSKAEVIISDQEIDYPKTTAVDLLLALTQAAADKHAPDLKPSGILIADLDRVPNPPPGPYALHHLPMLRTAKETIGKVMVTNIVSLGAVVGLSNVVSTQAIERAVLARVPRGTEDLNRRALAAGFALVGASLKV